jgi:hypothetical protein
MQPHRNMRSLAVMAILSAVIGCSAAPRTAVINDVAVRTAFGYRIVAVDDAPESRAAGRIATVVPKVLVEPGTHRFTATHLYSTNPPQTCVATVESGKEYRIAAAPDGTLSLVEDVDNGLVAAGSASADDLVSGISIRRDFQVVKELTPQELTAFNRQWNGKTKVSASPSSGGGEVFMIDIKSEDSGGRWTYYTSGLVTRVSKQVVPVYKVPEPKEFNRLIGAEK